MAAIALERRPAAGAVSRQALLAETWLKGTMAFLCLAPSMPGTPLKDTYAYVLVLLIVLPTTLFASRPGELARSLFRAPTLGLLAGLVASWLAVLTTPLRIQPADGFQLAREFFPVLLAVAAPCLLRKIDSGRRERIVLGFCSLFPVAALLGFVLQRYSPFFFEIMLRYYYTHAEFVAYMVTRPALTFGNPNVLGIAIALTGIVAATGRSSSSIALSAKLALTVLALIGTGSRTAIFAYFAAISCLVLTRTSTLLRSALVLGAVAVVAALTLDLSAMADRFIALSERYIHSRSSMSAREDVWTELLLKSEWPSYALFGLGPDKQRLVVADSGYVLQLYRYGIFGLLCQAWWMGSLLASGVSDRLRRRQTALAERRICLVICFAMASYAMAPLSDPRLGSLFFLLLASSLIDDRPIPQRCSSDLMSARVPPFQRSAAAPFRPVSDIRSEQRQ